LRASRVAVLLAAHGCACGSRTGLVEETAQPDGGDATAEAGGGGSGGGTDARLEGAAAAGGRDGAADAAVESDGSGGIGGTAGGGAAAGAGGTAGAAGAGGSSSPVLWRGPSSHGCAVRTGSPALWCWGCNAHGQLGDGKVAARSLAVQVAGLPAAGIAQVAGGSGHSCAVTSFGEVWCWGENAFGQLGIGGTTDSPKSVAVLSSVARVATGSHHTCALSGGGGTAGSLYCWGYNAYGQLGLGATGSFKSTPQKLSVSGWLGPTAGHAHTCAIRASDATAWCWGYNEYGQLGTGGKASAASPAQVPGLSGIVELAAGYRHTCARNTAGRVWCWGEGGYGQLGDGTAKEQLVPVEAQSLPPAVELVAGGAHTCVRSNASNLWCWGLNGEGQVGLSMGTSQADVPVALFGLGPVERVAAGGGHTCAQKPDRSVWCWGRNSEWQLGQETPHGWSDKAVKVLGLP
jgi:alpha-tubulin suppressor-like RCC1 family protein